MDNFLAFAMGETHLASTWATPVLIVDSEEIPMYVMESKTD